MSHVSAVKLIIKDLEALKQACNNLGFDFIENQKTYKWFGSWVGDYPMPEGFEEKDLGKCDHAIRVPGCSYEVGVVKRGDHYVLAYDFWRGGGLEKAIGVDGGPIRQAYAVESVKNIVKSKRNYRLDRELNLENGKRLVIRL
jgi:hypothetical protein